VAIPKICGIETEYGIRILPPGEYSPVSLSSLLVSSYVSEIQRQVDWDFEDESPGNDARGFSLESTMAPSVEPHLLNAVLVNGSRYYVDHAHPELSTPECATALELVRYDKAGEEILRRSMAAANRLLPEGASVVVYKNNSDGKGNSYGCHENYLMDRSTPFGQIVQNIVPHFVSRQVFTGAGKVGSEARVIDPGDDRALYQISQRADFFEELVGLETTLKRPIVNTRDEPHADPQRYRRLHVIVGDANLSEVATYLKVATTSIVLAMIEDGFFAECDMSLENPVQAMHEVSHDLGLRACLRLADGRTTTALGLQWDLLALAKKYGVERGLDCIGGEESGAHALARWETVLEALEQDPSSLSHQLDWVAKLELLKGYKDRNGLSWQDRRLWALDLQYHDLRPERSLFARLGMERLTSDEGVEAAVMYPPEDTRAWFRGTCLSRWPAQVVAANWDSLVFDLGSDPLRRVPMMDPLKGTAAQLGSLMRQASTPAELLRLLSS
jgi:proteasome accessory factor A